jgi:hypothetical protein
VWLGLLAMTVLVVLAWQSRARHALAPPAGPWLETPAGGMDVSTWAARQWLSHAALGGTDEGLSAECGHAPAAFHERYALQLPGGASGEVWRAVIDIDPDVARVTATQDPAVGLAPDAAAPRIAPARDQRPRANHNDTALPHRFARDQLEPLRRAWRSPALWGAPLSDAADGHFPAVRLEACVDGRYVVRLRRDTPASRKLAAALATLVAGSANTP